MPKKFLEKQKTQGSKSSKKIRKRKTAKAKAILNKFF